MEGESAGHLLATIVHTQQGPSYIARLVWDNGVEVTESTDILETLRDYYNLLYSTRCEGSGEDMLRFLSKMRCPVSLQTLGSYWSNRSH